VKEALSAKQFFLSSYDQTSKLGCPDGSYKCEMSPVTLALQGHSAILSRNGKAAALGCEHRRPQIGVKSYDEQLPSQDTMPSGGFSN
jgi:hypothetical protein